MKLLLIVQMGALGSALGCAICNLASHSAPMHTGAIILALVWLVILVPMAIRRRMARKG